MRSSIGARIVFLIVASLLMSVSFAEIYRAAALFLGPVWVSAAIVNTALAGFILLLRKRSSMDGGGRGGGEVTPAFFEVGPWRWPMAAAYMPAIGVAVGSVALVLVSSLFGDPVRGRFSWVQIAWLLWIPPVEEIVFRIGVGNSFRRYGGVVWGSYFSALVFSLVHLQPTVQRVAAGQIGVALGPLLLGLCCEAMWCRTQRLGPIIAFHAACNATALVFTLGDLRWMSWLKWLYL